MIWCDHCRKKVSETSDGGKLWCSFCGKVLVSEIYSSEPTFFKDASGQSQVSGRCVRSIQSGDKPSRETLYYNAKCELRQMRDALGMGENEEIIDIAMRLYRIAVEEIVVEETEEKKKNFTRGRRSELVRASCLYIACREKRKPYLLIEFSEYLKINVYVLGAVFLQLCEYLRLVDNPNYQRPVDPSMFMHRFTESLLGKTDKGVIKTAKQLMTSMKRDWMQSGRKPSGLCGAALYLSACLHGHKITKSDITRTVHICHATLTARLVEFENTESGSLTIGEFLVKEKELEELSKERNTAIKVDEANKDVICGHKDSRPFKLRLCKTCYDDMIEISGGFEGGSNPPAFQRAEMERMEKASAKKNATDSGIDTLPCQSPCNNKQSSHFEKALNSKAGSGNERLQFTEPESAGADTVKVNTAVDVGTEACDESGNFFDIDDAEVDGYLLDEEEQRNKKIIWEELNGVEEQAAKAGKKTNCPEDDAAAKKRKERKLARAAESNNSIPPQTAPEAIKQMLTKKRLSSKINFDALGLDNLFETSGAPDKSKKKRIESPVGNEEFESDAYENDDLGLEKEDEDDAYEKDDMGLEKEDEDDACEDNDMERENEYEDEEGTISVLDYENVDEDDDNEDWG